tara:strand:- start:889 stop:1497 length:609 start_codon:yes stop_codon:yes gene_type:complete
MKKKIYLYSEIFTKTFLENAFSDFELINLDEDIFFENKLNNKNILFFFKNKIKNNLDSSFFLKNNVIIFFLNKNKFLENKILEKTKIIYAPIAAKKFIDEANNFFLFNTKIFKDIKVLNEKIININTKKIYSLTQIESKILTELIDQKQISKDYILEKILLLKKDTETKTIESHLTRIRKKLLIVGSQLEILSRDNKIFFNN